VASRFLTALVALSVLGVSGCGDDDGASGGSGTVEHVDGESVTVSDAWARSSPPGVADGVVYLTIESAQDDQLAGALVPTDVAAAVEIHETVAGDDGASMQQVEAVDLPAGEAVTFEPGGLHVMLVDLAAPLVAGSSFELTLVFASSEPKTVTVDVRDEAP
jgi:copper(I)-binding protein